MSSFVSDVVKHAGLPQYKDPTVDTSHISDRLLKAIVKFESYSKNYSSDRPIKNTFKNVSTFSFHYVDESDMELNLNNSKVSQDSDILIITVKDNQEILKEILCQILH